MNIIVFLRLFVICWPSDVLMTDFIFTFCDRFFLQNVLKSGGFLASPFNFTLNFSNRKHDRQQKFEVNERERESCS